MQKLLEYQNKRDSKSKSNRDKTRDNETDGLLLPMPTVALGRLAEKRGDQDRTNDRRHQREHSTREDQRRPREQQTTAVQSGQTSGGGTLDADVNALVAEVRTTYDDQRRQEQVAALAAEFHPNADVVGGQVADENQLVAFEAFASAVSLVRLPTAESRVQQTLIFRVDEDVSRRVAVFSGQTPGRAADVGRAIAKMIARSGSSSSFIVWVPVVLVCAERPSMLEQLFNFYIGVLLSSVLVMILRYTINREKPRHRGPSRHNDAAASAALDAIERSSFPSGSASLIALAACFVAANNRFEATVVCVVGVFVLTTSLVDVTLGHHYVLDIVCGWLLGIAVYLFVRKFVWVPSHKCESIIRPIRGALHL